MLLAVTSITTAQQLYVEGGKTSSTFEYTNSQGNSLENLQATSNSYMALGYKSQVLIKNLLLNVGASYNSYGAIGSDAAVANFMEWNVDYADLHVGLDYNVFKLKKANVFIKGGMSAGFFVQGTQTLNKSVIDLKNNDDFDTTLVAMQLGAGFSHPISEDLVPDHWPHTRPAT